MKKLALIVLALALEVFGAPFVPANDQAVLERLPRNFKPLQRAADLPTVAAHAREFIQLARQTGEPRYLGYAQGVLTPFLSGAEPPLEALTLCAILRQSNHQFEASLRDLDFVLKKSPRDKSAFITKLSVLQAQGRINEARQLCQSAPWLASDLIGLTALASISSLNGQLKPAIVILENAIGRASEDKSWALTSLAEMHVRAGNLSEAEKAFRSALDLNPDDIYLRTAFADFLLDGRRSSEVLALTKERTNADGLLLRLALAERTPERVKELQHRFEAARAAVGNLHAREEAIFALRLLDNPSRALQLALENWRNQREPLDARILLECALANCNPAVAQPVLDWLNLIKLEDVRLNALCSKL